MTGPYDSAQIYRRNPAVCLNIWVIQRKVTPETIKSGHGRHLHLEAAFFWSSLFSLRPVALIPAWTWTALPLLVHSFPRSLTPTSVNARAHAPFHLENLKSAPKHETSRISGAAGR